jgi:hypothetical protein
MQTAMMSGRYKGHIENANRRPYWEYVAVMDRRTRPSHAALNGKIYKYDDPFWETFYPPNGWNCRCRVRTRSLRDIREKNLTVEDSAGRLFETDQPLNSLGDTIRATGIRITYKGKNIRIVPDAGWGYNPGKAAYQIRIERYDRNTARRFVSEMINSPAFDYFFQNTELKQNFPVAVLPEEYQKQLKTSAHVAYISNETLAKNKAAHPELTIDAYRNLQNIIENAELVLQEEDRWLVFIKSGDQYYLTVIKSTQSGEGLFVQSLRLTNPNDVNRLKKRGTIILDKTE